MPRKLEAVSGLSVEVPRNLGTVRMRPFTAREYVAMKRGEMDDVGIMELTVGAIITYLPGRDPWDLPPEDLLGLTANWLAAKLDDAIPPPTA